MKACIIENDIVVNLIEVPDGSDLTPFNAIDLGSFAAIGDSVVDGQSVEAAEREQLHNDEEAAKPSLEARQQRDALLAETDWWAVSDRTMTQEQIDYRQALRDLPEQEGFPDVEFPVKP